MSDAIYITILIAAAIITATVGAWFIVRNWDAGND